VPPENCVLTSLWLYKEDDGELHVLQDALILPQKLDLSTIVTFSPTVSIEKDL
jgi:hypothetical protein